MLLDHIPLGDYKEVLMKYISPDQLPEAYGGTRCEPDPYCTKYVSLANYSIELRIVSASAYMCAD